MYNACLWAEYVILQDNLGMWDLLGQSNIIWNTLSNYVEDEHKYIITCTPDNEGSCSVSGTLGATDDERSGTMVVHGGVKPKLFLGVYFNLTVEDKGDRIQIGDTAMPPDISDSDRFTFSFGSDSYYTMCSR